MYKENGHEIFVVDGHMHFWDANPENWRNEYGEGWIRCFYDFHTASVRRNMSGPLKSIANTVKRR